MDEILEARLRRLYPSGTKICIKCKKPLSLSDFYLRVNDVGWCYVRSMCKSCSRLYNLHQRRLNRSKVVERKPDEIVYGPPLPRCPVCEAILSLENMFRVTRGGAVYTYCKNCGMDYDRMRNASNNELNVFPKCALGLGVEPSSIRSRKIIKKA